jgi:hypothetical protein
MKFTKDLLACHIEQSICHNTELLIAISTAMW